MSLPYKCQFSRMWHSDHVSSQGPVVKKLCSNCKGQGMGGVDQGSGSVGMVFTFLCHYRRGSRLRHSDNVSTAQHCGSCILFQYPSSRE